MGAFASIIQSWNQGLKVTDNLEAYHLSRIENPHIENISGQVLNDVLPKEHLYKLEQLGNIETP